MNTQDKQINSAVNSCRMALYNNNKAKSTNKTTRLINNLFKKYRKDDTENENEDENTKLDTLSIGLQLKEAVDSIFDPTTGMSEEEKKKFVQKLYRKLESGKKLSADEMQYLRKNDPVTYAKAAKVQVLRESLKKQLKSATSKEKAADIYTQAMSRIRMTQPGKKLWQHMMMYIRSSESLTSIKHFLIQRKRQRKRQLIIKIKMHRAGKKKKIMIQKCQLEKLM